MDRRWMICLLGLALVGCAGPRKSAGPTSAPKPPNGENSPFDSLSSIHQSINGGMRPATEVASQGSREPAETAAAAPAALLPLPDASPIDTGAKQVSNRPEPASLPAPEPFVPAGRPAPFKGVEPAAPREQAPPLLLPESGRPAPSAGVEPAGPRPQAAPPIPEAIPGPAPAPATAPALPDLSQPPVLPAPAPAPVTASKPIDLTAPPALPTADPLVQPSSTGQGLPTPKRDQYSLVGRPAARVGDEIITVHQLRDAYRDKLDMMPPEVRSNPAYKEEILRRILDNLIDRTLILQAAKRQMKDPKQLKSFYDAIEKVWLEHEVPTHLKTYHATNVTDLREKLAAKEKSYEDLRQEFRDETLAREFLSMKMKEKLTVSLPDMDSYYRKHLKDFDRPAQIVWREIVVDHAKYPTRVAARQKVDTLLARLRKGEDFASLAKKESSGPTASAGGKWETTPGSYGVPSVNTVLNTLPVNQISPVIEAPASFHIVLVENRRAAGPAEFHEVQDQVRAAVADEKRKKAAGGFLADLRQNTIISTMFETPTSDPAAIKVNATRP